MKILVLSLLRLGDLIQQKPLLQGLRGQFPQAEIHILINRQFSQVENLLMEIPLKFHFFERDLLQKSMGEAGFNLFTPFEILEQLVTSLNSENFDVIYNWTHNRLSTYLMGILQCPDKKGLTIEGKKLKGLESPWLRYFNDHFSGHSHSFFHHVELLSRSFNLPVQRYLQRPSATNKIFFHCFTSDAKKNWPVQKFAELRGKIREEFPHLAVQVLATRPEAEILAKHFGQDEILICDLIEAREALSRALILICVDSSLKHLAAEVGTSIIEISLGGSNAIKNSAFAQSVHVLESELACSPCRHSNPCSQASHLCAEKITVATVMQKLTEVLAGTAATFKDVSFQIERQIWSAYLEGGEGPREADQTWLAQVADKTQLLWGYQVKFESCEDFHQIYSTLEKIREEKIDSGFYFQKLSQVFGDRFASADTALDALKNALAESRALLQIRTEVINKTRSTQGGINAERA